jgi:D-3-phosphoglycerate dehydrogenase / 2-oxoglutarate reductase
MNAPPLVYVTQPIHPDAMAILEKSAHVVTAFGDSGVPLESVLPDVEGIIARFEGLPASAIERASRLRVIARAGIGYENIAIDTAQRVGVPVFVTEGANAVSVAEHAFALLLAAARRIPVWDSRTRDGGSELRQAREGELALELRGLTIGILGLGSIGTEVARIASKGFGMRAVAHHPRRTPDQIRATGAEPVDSLDDLLRESDVLSVQVPLTDQTRALISDRELALMPQGSVLVNVSRGGVVDEAALYRALTRGPLRAAGVDVWETKVPIPNHPLLGLESVVVSPHRAGRTDAAQRRMGVRAARAVVDFLDGRTPADVRDVTGQMGSSIVLG